jgi:hypothetical protein
MLKGLDPSRHYVRVYKAAQYQGIEFYEDLGFEVERVRTGGPELPGGAYRKRQEGDAIEYQDHVLMSCSLERWKEIEQAGPDGDGGQLAADALEDRIIDKSKGVEDPLRGMHGIRGRQNPRVIYTQNSTSEAEPETD